MIRELVRCYKAKLNLIEDVTCTGDQRGAVCNELKPQAIHLKF